MTSLRQIMLKRWPHSFARWYDVQDIIIRFVFWQSLISLTILTSVLSAPLITYVFEGE
ncbi:hypothetical protein [Mycolicibacterium chlorophenolicum]|uniref:Uncharacterized protein n=1 Tax=Mycolicibacterium chlorophenolicum TaxID=37916 RepID=A0A0J6YDR8_9MYCO|nr:hypothetical protein [Mycolicibacterium chlorophenolicum]KMO70976.1 hypothetical protein MCHLDSM_05871 [Mycolicibacterium chlorophenolicum]